MRRPFYKRARKSWYCHINGKQVRLSDNEKEAHHKWLELLDKPDDPDALIKTLVRAYMKHLAVRVKEGSIGQAAMDRYGHHLHLFATQCGVNQIKDLKRFHLTNYLNSSDFTIHQKHSAISSVKSLFNWATIEELVEKNPYRGYKRPQLPCRTHLIEDDHHKALMTARDEGRQDQSRAAAFRPMLVALRHSGRRAGEICRVDVADTSGDFWLIRKHKTINKTQQPQLCYLGPCLSTLTKILAHGRESGPLLRNSNGAAWTPNAVTRRMTRMRERLGLPKETMAHAYRHTYITKSLKNGVDISTVAELVGHANCQMIASNYSHIGKMTDHMREAAAKAINPSSSYVS